MNELIHINYDSDTPTALVNWEIFDSKEDIPTRMYRWPYAGRVYVMEIGNTLKIGSTQDFRNRVFTHARRAKVLGMPTGRILVSVCHDRFRRTERIIQEKFKARRDGRTEFFGMFLSEFLEQINLIDALINYEDAAPSEPFSSAWAKLMSQQSK